MKVTVVLDPAFGRDPHASLGPAFWLIESPENRALAERLRRNPGCDPNSAVFVGGGSATEDALSIWPTVMLHHPDWTEIEFIGVPLSEDLWEELIEAGLCPTPTEMGFGLSST